MVVKERAATTALNARSLNALIMSLSAVAV